MLLLAVRLGSNSRSHLAIKAWMVLVHHNAVVVLATSVTATTWMLPVLANAAMASADVPALLPVLLEPCRQPAAGLKKALGSSFTAAESSES